jgi:hypothetical protein
MMSIHSSSARRLVPLALVAVIAACDSELAPQFEPTGQGELAGRLFFDVDNNGLYTPVGGDIPFASKTVTVFERGTTTSLGTQQTDANGAFSFTGLPVGTHEVVVAQDQIISGNDTLKLCRSPLPVSIYTNEQTFVLLNAKLGCVIPISQALKSATGTAITVAGIVTAPPGTFRSDNLYLQDPSGGIQVFGLPGTTPTLAAGDSIEVSGTFSPFRSEGEITSPRVAANVKKGVGVPAPIVMTTKQLSLLTSTSPSIGKLITVRKVTVGAFASGNAPIDDASGPSQVRLDGNVANTVPQSTFQAGKCYDITGVAGIFDNGVQLKPRGPADIAEVACQ